MTEKEITLLVEKGIGFIHIEYMGGGDSGAIETITYVANSCEDMQDAWNEEDVATYCQGRDIVDKPKELDENIIENLAYKHLNNIEDWWNNDGGYGGLVIAIPSLEFKNTNVIQYTETESFEHSGILDKEEL